MRLSQAWIVARHDMAIFRQKRGILIGLIAFPVGVGFGFPALVWYILSTGAPDPRSWLPALLDAFSFWFVIGAAMLPTTIAAYSIAGEKVSKSLEPLLASPTTDGEILLGKSLSALVPTLLAMWAGSVVFQALIDVLTRGPFGYLFYPNWQMAIILFIAMPIVVLLAIEASVLISSRVTDVRSAQQYSGVIFLPLIFLYIAAEIALPLNVTNLLIISGIYAVIVLVLFFTGLKTFHREEILTRWK